MCEICSKLIIKFQRYRSGAFIGNFEQSLHFSSVSIFDLKKDLMAMRVLDVVRFMRW